MRIAATIAVVSGLALASQAEACSRHMSRGELASNWLAGYPRFDAVVDVEVTGVARTPAGGWLAIGRHLNTQSGKPTPREFVFGNKESVVSSCGLPYETPVLGELWVLYLVRSGEAWTAKVFLPADLRVGAGFEDAPQPARRPARVEGLRPPLRVTPRR